MKDNTQSFEEIVKQMKTLGMKCPPQRVNISIQNSKEVLWSFLRHFLAIENKKAIWLPEYEEIASWLSKNDGKGLFLIGNCGRGKSLLGRYVIPAILLKYLHKVVSVYDVQEMNNNIDLVLKKNIISLDDIGTEEISVKYGEKRLAFAEIIDAAEKHGKLLIVSTNLDGDKIREKYGDRVIDRIHSVMIQVIFNGKSLRK